MNYNRRLQRLIYSAVAAEATIGERFDSFANGTTYWGRVEQLNGDEKIVMGAQRALTSVKIYIRQYPTFNCSDRIRDTGTNEVYHIMGITRGDNEIIITAEKGLPYTNDLNVAISNVNSTARVSATGTVETIT